MDITQQPKIKVESIFLKEVNFKRAPVITSPLLDIDIGIKAGSIISDTQDVLETELICTIETKDTDTKEVTTEINVTMIGVFKKEGDGNMDLETFSKVSAPSIIFPYIRELVANLTMKAGLNPIILPPTNFQAITTNQEKNK